MAIKKFDSLIGNATAILSMLPASPSGKAVREAPLALGGKKDLRVLCRVGSDSDKIFFRILSALSHPADGFDTAALLRLHAFIFDGIRPDAGKLRAVPAETGGSSFADPSLIGGSLKRLLGKLADMPGPDEVKREDFAMNLTYFFGEMFILCPFRSASLFTEALFFAMFAPTRGFRLDFTRTDGTRLFEAAKRAFLTDEPTDLFVCLNDAVVYASIESGGKEIPVVEAEQVRRELKVKGKPKTLVKRGTARKEKPKKDEIPKKPRPEKKARPTKKEAPVRAKPAPAVKPKLAPEKRDDAKAVQKVFSEAEMAAAREAIEAQMRAAQAAIAAEAEAAKAAIEAEKAAARAEAEQKAKQEAEQKAAAKKAAKKSGYDKSSRGKNSLKKALARTVLLFEDIPDFARDDDKFSPLPPEKENPLLLPSHESAEIKSEAAGSGSLAEKEAAEKDKPTPLPKLAPIKKIERAPEEKQAANGKAESPAPIAVKAEAPAPAEKAERKESAKSATPVQPKASEPAAKQAPAERRAAKDAESEEDALARKVADMSKLPSSVLKKAAHIKEQIELLQKELKDVLKSEDK